MFVQVIQGKVSDPAAMHSQLDKWLKEVSGGAAGWLGTTSGVTGDGRFIAVVRFESEEVAQHNSDRPEQSAWWEETAALFDEEPTFQNSTTVDVDTAGEPGEAGFVQVMQGRSSDPERVRELMANDPTDWQAFRPEILGSLSAGHEGGAWTMVLYFTSEEEAREGERKEPPPKMQQTMEQMNALMEGEPVYFDLKDPWLQSPG